MESVGHDAALHRFCHFVTVSSSVYTYQPTYDVLVLWFTFCRHSGNCTCHLNQKLLFHKCTTVTSSDSLWTSRGSQASLIKPEVSVNVHFSHPGTLTDALRIATILMRHVSTSDDQRRLYSLSEGTTSCCPTPNYKAGTLFFKCDPERSIRL